MATKKDFTQVAHAVFVQATGGAPASKVTAKQEAGRKGGLAGGKKRMAALTEAQRHELAMLGVASRKAPTVPKAASAVKSTKVVR
jgi:hypothetical protein